MISVARNIKFFLREKARDIVKKSDRLLFYADLLTNSFRDSKQFPLVTVVVPLYNNEQYINQCLKSVQEQNYRHLECIVVDDGSTDGGPEFVRKFTAHDNRFGLVQHKNNLGLAVSRNTGLQQARGDYVLFLDSDDFLLQHTIWHRVRTLKRDVSGYAAGAYCNIAVTPENGWSSQLILSFLRYRNEGMKDFLSCRGECPFTVHAPLVVTSILKNFRGFDESIRNGGEDWDLWSRLIRHGYRFIPSPHFGGVYRQRTGSLIHQHAPSHYTQAAALVERAYHSLPPSQVVEKAPYVYHQPLPYYEKLHTQARRALQFAAIAYVSEDRNGFDKIIKEVPVEAWSLPSTHLEVHTLLELGMQRALSARPRKKEQGNNSQRRIYNEMLRRIYSLVSSQLNGKNSQSNDINAQLDVLFLPHNGYHTREMACVTPYLKNLGLRYRFVNIDHVHNYEGVESELVRLGLPYVDYVENCLWQLRPRLLFVMNDWGGVACNQVLVAKELGIATCALVEGAQDFEDMQIADLGLDSKRWPYMRVDYPLLIGDFDRKYIKNPNAVVVGSPRIEALLSESPTSPEEPLVVVNSNFTYGVYTSIQKKWIEGVIRACKNAELNYVINQHPADKMDLSGYNRANQPLYELIGRSSVIVSRFSSVIYEAMALGKPVIYHNPHGERVATFQEPLGAYPITTNVRELSESLKAQGARRTNYRKICKGFFEYHVSVDPQKLSAQRIADKLHQILALHSDTGTSDENTNP